MSAIIISLKDDRHRIGSELTMREFAAIGYMTVSWAQLEHILLERTRNLADKAGVDIPEDATALSFKKRLRAFRTLAKETMRKSKKRDKLLTLLTSIGSAVRSRNRITHGLWNWLPSDPDKMHASSFRVPFHFEEPFDLEKLTKLGDLIGQLNFQLRFPEGKREAMKYLVKQRTQQQLVLSRLGAQVLSGKVSLNLDHDQPTPQEDN